MEHTKVNTTMAFPMIVNGIADYVKKYDLRSLIIGLSGGIDSTVCAALCWLAKRKLYEEDHMDVQVIGVSLPCYSNGEDENDIATRCSCFCDRFKIQNLEYLYYQIRDHLEAGMEMMFQEDEVSLSKIAQGNIKARLRMIYLYNLASMTRGIVVDTDNLTEHFLGFWTIHGDDGDLNPIGGLWKTEVYELAKTLIGNFTALSIESKEFNKEEDKLDAYRKASEYDCMVKCLEDACAITPTDGNGVADGGDLAQIAPGHTYADVDDILQNLLVFYEAHVDPSPEVWQEMCHKHGEETVKKVIERYSKSKFKRMHRPLVINLLGDVEGKDKSFTMSLRSSKKD